jgi:hypothetical protein
MSKLEEVLGAYREGKTITCGHKHYNKSNCCLANAVEWEILGEWTIKEDPKPKVKMWPAIWSQNGNCWNVTDELFASLEDAKRACDEDRCIWPAIPGADGSFEIPGE